MTTPARPVTILIAALGGEGGGVLSDWIVSAASAQGYPVQSTSIPGVAQRTGATTYYLEIFPVTWSDLGGKRPVLALTPGIGDVDLIVASELMEAGRTVAGGFATADRTSVIASTHRSYAIAEKAAMGDGRYDDERLGRVIAANSRNRLLFDMDALARESGAMINAVMLGAIAGRGGLPFPPEACETAIRADGKAIEANLRGFRAGLAVTQPSARQDAATARPLPIHASSLSMLDIDMVIPEAARDIVREGLRRLTAYQDAGYARLYLDRLAPICDADLRAHADGRLAAATARNLAVRMSYEDVIRVAEAKISPQRFARIAEEVGATSGEPVIVVDYLKPGIDEICQLLPPRFARRVLALAERRGWLGRLYWGMEVKTSSITGYLRFWLLAKLRSWRPRSFRYAQEQQAIDQWLSLVADAARLSGEFAIEVADCARLIKGYGDTWQRGMANYRAIEARVIRPALAGRVGREVAADAVASARTAALIDPEGEGLARCLKDIEGRTALQLAAE